MTSEIQESVTKEEQWVLDLFSVSKNRTVSPKVMIGMWESTFPKEGVAGLRKAVRNLINKKALKISPEGSLSLVEES